MGDALTVAPNKENVATTDMKKLNNILIFLICDRDIQASRQCLKAG